MLLPHLTRRLDKATRAGGKGSTTSSAMMPAGKSKGSLTLLQGGTHHTVCLLPKHAAPVLLCCCQAMHACSN